MSVSKRLPIPISRLVLGATLAVGAAIGVAIAANRSSAAAPVSIVGVWEFVSETDAETGKVLNDQKSLEALWVFTKRYYVVARMSKDRKSLPAAEVDKLAPTERVKYYQQLMRYTSTAGE